MPSWHCNRISGASSASARAAASAVLPTPASPSQKSGAAEPQGQEAGGGQPVVGEVPASSSEAGPHLLRGSLVLAERRSAAIPAAASTARLVSTRARCAR